MSMLRFWDRSRRDDATDGARSAPTTGTTGATGPDVSAESSSRRAILTTGAAAIGAAVASTVAGALPAAAAGSVQLGVLNNSTSNTTIRNTQASAAARGLIGSTTAAGSAGLQGSADGSNGIGVTGTAHVGAAAIGVRGASVPGTGVVGSSTNGVGVQGTSTNAKGVAGSGKTVGVEGTATGTGIGVAGQAHLNAASIGVRGGSVPGTGVLGSSTSGAGVQGNSTNGYGVRGSGGYNGVYGNGGSYGVIGSSSGYGVYGSGDTALYASGGQYGVQAYGSAYGVYAQGGSYGVYATGPTGVYGTSSSGSGVSGATSHPNVAAVYGTGGQYGVHGVNGRSAGIRGDSGYVGVWGEGGDWGFFSIATNTSGQNYGIMSETKSRTSGFAGYFKGNVYVDGTLSKLAGSFRIDHPLDPDRRWLSHSFVESPDMMNVYNGTVTLDGRGQATVRLPRYFEVLNRDFRYQLTPIGGPAPDLHVARKVQRNAFRIAGGSPGQEISWQITGIRQDDYANAHRIKVDTKKSKADQGTRVFVAKGSGAKQMQVGPVRPKGRQRPPAKVKAPPSPRDVRPRAPRD